MNNGNDSPLQQTEGDKPSLSVAVAFVFNGYSISIKPYRSRNEQQKRLN